MPRTQKKARIAFPCRVCSQECLMEEESLQCDGCESWLHQHCIGMSWTQYVNFNKPHLHLQFFCRQRIGSSNSFNLLSSLSRIAALQPDVVIKENVWFKVCRVFNIVVINVYKRLLFYKTCVYTKTEN